MLSLITSQNITDKAVLDAFLEAQHIPTDLLTPSNTYHDLLRLLESIFQFEQRFSSQCDTSVFANGRTLDSKWNSFTSTEQDCFNSVGASFGIPPVIGNPTLRTTVKRSQDYWGAIFIGGVEL